MQKSSNEEKSKNNNSKIKTLNSHLPTLTTHYSFHHSGITLIALVVTVVVLLILAGVTITLMFGENNIFDLAKDAADKTNTAIEDEKTKVEGLDQYIKDNVGDIGNSGGSSSDEKPSTGGGSSEEWKKLTFSEKLSILREKKPISNLYSDFNSVCECGHAQEIFEKAKELGLISVYDNSENGKVYDYLEAPITEQSLVYYSFICRNEEQEIGGLIPVKASLNYEICVDGTNWYDSGKPTYDNDSGDYENFAAWLSSDYVNIGFTMFMPRAKMYSNLVPSALGQVYHCSIQVLTKTNFNKAANALGLDLSSYNCIHNK